MRILLRDRGLQIHAGAVLAEPFFALLIVGHDFIQFVPECLGVVGMDEVGEFVDDDVVYKTSII